MHIANNYLLITHMQTLRAAPSHATMADVYPTAIDAMETTIAMTTVMKRDAVMTVETTVMKTDVVCHIMVCIVWGSHLVIINPRRACAARVTVVVLCVCLSTTILALQATRWLMSDTISFSATRA